MAKEGGGAFLRFVTDFPASKAKVETIARNLVEKIVDDQLGSGVERQEGRL